MTSDVVANLYGGRQIVNELRGPNFGARQAWFGCLQPETTFFTGINGGIYRFYCAIYRSNVVIKISTS